MHIRIRCCQGIRWRSLLDKNIDVRAVKMIAHPACRSLRNRNPHSSRLACSDCVVMPRRLTRKGDGIDGSIVISNQGGRWRNIQVESSIRPPSHPNKVCFPRTELWEGEVRDPRLINSTINRIPEAPTILIVVVRVNNRTFAPTLNNI